MTDNERNATSDPCDATESPADESYVNADDIFYWMEDPCGADIPLLALWIDIPTGCRFCC